MAADVSEDRSAPVITIRLIDAPEVSVEAEIVGFDGGDDPKYAPPQVVVFELRTNRRWCHVVDFVLRADDVELCGRGALISYVAVDNAYLARLISYTEIKVQEVT